MDRAAAIDLLKELTYAGWVNPQLLSIEKNQKGEYSLIIKPSENVDAVAEYLAVRGLALREDKARGYYIIFKP